jgi:predicted dehydrogenase
MLDKTSRQLFLPRLAVLGGGRWARVLVGVLDELLPTEVALSMHSRRNALELRTWRESKQFRRPILIAEDDPHLNDSRDCAVIVVNAARDHAAATRMALAAGAPTLVEKPVALTAAEVEDLMRLAQASTARLAAAHVFMFPRYLDRFRRALTCAGGACRIHVRWADPRGENRHGESKRYDPGLPVYADWLPHVLSMLNVLVTDAVPAVSQLRCQRGGAHVGLDIALGAVTCTIDMERNGMKRERRIEAECGKGERQVLDFSQEPGRIFDGSDWRDADPDWTTSPRPVASMLHAFLHWSASGVPDRRLDIQVGLAACRAIEQAQTLYREAQSGWLVSRLSQGGGWADPDVIYALEERLQARVRFPAPELERRISRLLNFFDGRVDESWLASAATGENEWMRAEFI